MMSMIQFELKEEDLVIWWWNGRMDCPFCNLQVYVLLCHGLGLMCLTLVCLNLSFQKTWSTSKCYWKQPPPTFFRASLRSPSQVSCDTGTKSDTMVESLCASRSDELRSFFSVHLDKKVKNNEQTNVSTGSTNIKWYVNMNYYLNNFEFLSTY